MFSTVTVHLFKRVQTGMDAFNRPTFSTIDEDVPGVLVGEPSTDDVTAEINLSGKRIAYTLAIPKGDTHDWLSTDVALPEPFEGKYRTIGYPTAGIEENIPLRWNKKVKLERYE